MFSLINILGLTVGITCCLMIFLFIMNEFSYDKFHKNGENIYRVMRVSHQQEGDREIPYLSPPYATALRNDYPDAVKSVVRISREKALISYNNTSFMEKKIFLADSNFFSFFSFPLLKGDPATVLRDISGAVITESMAKKYFGNDDAMGKEIQMDAEHRFKITGIAKDLPSNSHIEFDIVVPILKWRQDGWFNQWPSNSLFTYVQLNPAVNPADLKSRFPAFMNKYLGDFYRESGLKMDLTIKPLHGIYFEGEKPWDPVKHGNRKMVYIFMSIAILILVIACINFMNLATARATDRSKEIGLRKVLGAMRKQLAGQFIFESLLFATAATALAILLLQAVMPLYNNFLGYELPPYWQNGWFYAFTGGTIIVVGLLTGSYPALMMSSFSPIESLKGKLKLGKQGSLFRRALVVFQFGISVLLIVSVAIVMNQMNFVRNTDLGFEKEQTMIVRLDNNDIWNNKVLFKKELEKDPAVSMVSLMTGEPGGFHDMDGFESEARPGEKILFNTEFSDFEYVKTLGLKIIAGRDFSSSFPTDSTSAVLINRAVASQLGYSPEQAIGKWIKNATRDSLRRIIVGVVENYHFTSLKSAIAPLVISTQRNERRLALIKLKITEMKPVIDRIKNVYAHHAPVFPFEYEFLDERFNLLYKTEIKQETLLSTFSLIAILIACLGLFGLASYTAIKRTKEIGVRKVLGSSVKNIIVLLSKDLLKPVLLGTIIAIPAGYYIMEKWLEGFAYRTPVHWWIFGIAALVSTLIAVLTVSAQAIKAALANPVKSLRTE